MSDDSIFVPVTTVQEVVAVQNPEPKFTIPQEAAEFVGVGKKYQSVEDALKSVPHAQKHISTLETELIAAKEELLKRRTTEDLLEELKAGIPQTEVTPQAGVTREDITATVSRLLEQKEIEKTAATNITIVTSSFIGAFGDSAEDKFNQIALESGLTVGQLNGLASSSPQAVLKLAGIGLKQNGVVTKIQSSINTGALSQTTSQTELSARLPRGATTRDMVTAWNNAGTKINKV